MNEHFESCSHAQVTVGDVGTEMPDATKEKFIAASLTERPLHHNEMQLQSTLEASCYLILSAC